VNLPLRSSLGSLQGYVNFIDLEEARRAADEGGIDVPDVVNKKMKQEEGGATSTTKGTGGAFEGW
jgi:hypothetical protein